MSPLPIVTQADSRPKSAIRSSKRSRWRLFSLLTVHLLIAAHIAHWLVTGSTITPVEPSEAMAFARSGVINAGLLFFGAAILTTAIFGRFFCGWACHVVALQDLCRWILVRCGIRPVPLRSRWLRWVPILAFVYMFVWPALYRWWIGSPFHIETEWTTSNFWATFPGWTIGILTLLICGFGAVYFLGAKGFCTYACPYGAIFGVADRLAPMRIRVTDACAGCGHCTAVCTSNVRVHEEVREFGMVVDSGCMKCLDCVSVCPNQALYFGPGPLPGKARPSERSRGQLEGWEEVILLLAFFAAFLAFRGLYRLVPFLLALGWSAILAFLTLQAVRMFRRPNLTFRRIALRRQKRWTFSGKLFLVAFAFLALFWSHSAAIRLQQVRGERSDWLLARAKPVALDLSQQFEPFDAKGRERAQISLEALDRVERWGLVRVVGDASKRSWLSFLGGENEAQTRGRIASALDREDAPAEMLLLLSRLESGRGQTAQALVAARKALEIEPESPLIHLNVGILLAELGDLPRAINAFEYSLDLAESASAFYGLALAHAIGGNVDLALNLFERALVLEPNSVPARENLAGLLASQGRYEESIEHFQAALELRPEEVETRLRLAQVLHLRGDQEQALEELARVLGSEPENPIALELRRQWKEKIE